MNGRAVRRITKWLIFVWVILGCATPTIVTPPPPDPGAVEVIVAQTAGAAQFQTKEALPPTITLTPTPAPTRTATLSPTPTATFLFLFPTNTDIPEGFLADGGGGSSSSGGGGGSSSGGSNNSGDEPGIKKTPVPREWACGVISKSPANGEYILGGSTFKATWTVRNAGTQSWPKKSVDIVYTSGLHLEVGKPYYDIPAAIGPGGTVTISVTMVAPKRSGEHSTKWSLKIGKTEFCGVKFTFNVR